MITERSSNDNGTLTSEEPELSAFVSGRSERTSGASSNSTGESSKPPLSSSAFVSSVVLFVEVPEEALNDSNSDGARVALVGDSVGSNVVNIEGIEEGTSVSTVSEGSSVCTSDGSLEGAVVDSGTGRLVGLLVGTGVGSAVVGATVGNFVGRFVGAGSVVCNSW